jgi:hypothetical protein
VSNRNLPIEPHALYLLWIYIKYEINQCKQISYSNLISPVLVGHAENPAEKLGKVEDFMIDLTNSRIALLLSFGGILGIGDKLSPSHDALYVDVQMKYLCRYDKQTLKTLRFDKDNWPATNDRSLADVTITRLSPTGDSRSPD